jgi:hypothetical protein
MNPMLALDREAFIEALTAGTLAKPPGMDGMLAENRGQA